MSLKVKDYNKMKLIQMMKLGLVLLFTLMSVSVSAETKKLYGVQGPKLVHKKLSNKTHTYVVNGINYTTKAPSAAKQYSKIGVATYYHKKFIGKKTSSGEAYDPERYTAAHKTLPLNSYALVTNLHNRRKVIVRINDRGPFVKERIIDLSRVAAKELGILTQGTGQVKVEALYVGPKGKISGSAVNSLVEMAKTSEATKRLDMKESPNAVIPNASFSNYKIKILNLTYKQAIKAIKLAKHFKAETHVNSNRKSYDLFLGPLKTKEDVQQLKAQLQRLNFSKQLIIYSYN